MYVWRLWGDVWEIGSAEDYWAYTIILLMFKMILYACLLAITIPLLVLEVFGAFKERAAEREYRERLGIRADPCPHCGNTQMPEVTPCIRCGR